MKKRKEIHDMRIVAEYKSTLLEKIKEIDAQDWLVSEGYSADEAYTAEELLQAIETFIDQIESIIGEK